MTMHHRFLAAATLALGLTCSGTALAQTADAKPATAEKKAKKDHHAPDIKKKDLGTTTIAGLKFDSITQEGAITAGEEGAFDIVIGEGEKPPKAMRAWIGVASGEGSVKTKLEKEPNRHYHSHVNAPKTIPPGSQYWLEVEPEKGPKAKAAFDFFTEE